jgi:hypothetical protein
MFLCRFTPRHFFFLDPSDILRGVHVNPALPIGLANAIYLWATRTSPTPTHSTRTWETEFLRRTVHHLSQDVAALGLQASIQSQYMPHAHILQIIQASVLLSLYYLESARPLEGRYHSAAAVSLAFTAGLHRVGSVPYTAQVAPPLLLSFIPLLPSPPEGQMISAFWTVVLLDNYWVVTSGAPSLVPSDAAISTPYPVRRLPIMHAHSGRLKDLIQDIQHHSDSPHTSLTKASILLESTITFVSRESSKHLPLQALDFA